MKMLSWNCQGLGNPLTFQELRVIVTQERPNLVFIMETKNSEQKVLRIKRRLKFQNSYIVNPEGIAGGLALFWDDQLQVTIDSSSATAIFTRCYLGCAWEILTRY